MKTFVVLNIASVLNRRVDFDINFPKLSGRGTYDLKGDLVDLIPIFGKGNFLVEPSGKLISKKF